MIVQRLLACWILALAAVPARASFLSGEALDTMADVLAIVDRGQLPGRATGYESSGEGR